MARTSETPNQIFANPITIFLSLRVFDASARAMSMTLSSSSIAESEDSPSSSSIFCRSISSFVSIIFTLESEKGFKFWLFWNE